MGTGGRVNNLRGCLFSAFREWNLGVEFLAQHIVGHVLVSAYLPDIGVCIIRDLYAYGLVLVRSPVG